MKRKEDRKGKEDNRGKEKRERARKGKEGRTEKEKKCLSGDGQAEGREYVMIGKERKGEE